MLLKYLLNLQLFGEGGDGGDGADGGAAEGVGITGDEELARIPERARDMYKRAKGKHQVVQPTPQTTNEEVADKPAKLSYSDLIKSDDYKEEHKAYMEKTIQDRFKKYKGMEEANKKMSDALGKVANKYGLDPEADDYMDQLTERITKDNSFYEDYAMEHDISTSEAKELLDLKNQVAQQKLEEKRRAQVEAEMAEEAKKREAFETLRANGERTKQIYPSFNLEEELKNPKFVQLCWSTNHDTTAAYRVVHYDELSRAQGQVLSQQAAQQAANSIAANKARPIENGLSSQATTVTQTDWSKASLSQIREQAANWRRGK